MSHSSCTATWWLLLTAHVGSRYSGIRSSTSKLATLAPYTHAALLRSALYCSDTPVLPNFGSSQRWQVSPEDKVSLAPLATWPVSSGFLAACKSVSNLCGGHDGLLISLDWSWNILHAASRLTSSSRSRVGRRWLVAAHSESNPPD